MYRPAPLLAALLAAAAASLASAQTVKPSDFDASRAALDEQILSRVRARKFRAQGEKEAAPPPAVFPLANGTMTVEESWTSDPTTGEDVLHGFVSFAPGPKAPACRALRFVQAARVETAPGKDLDWAQGQQDRNLTRTSADAASGAAAGWFVDHDATRCRAGAACSPYYRDSWANPDESADGASAPPDARAASLADYPFGWDFFERISLEACARCVDTGVFLGCARWGAEWPSTGARSLSAPSAAEAPSPTFAAALRLFDAFYPAKP